MKKFLAMFAFAAAIVLGAFTLASCGDDDDDNNTSNPISGTVWKGTLYFGSDPLGDITLKFNPVTYEITAGVLIGTGGTYSMSSDNKTVYLSTEEGQTIGKISADGKTMTISNSTTTANATLTKQ